MITSPLLSNIRHRAMITPVRPLLTRLIHIIQINGQFIVRLKLLSKRKLSIRLDLHSNVLYKFIASKKIQPDMNYLFKNTQLHRASRALMDEPESSTSERSRENACYERYCFIQITVTWTRKAGVDLPLDWKQPRAPRFRWGPKFWE